MMSYLLLPAGRLLPQAFWWQIIAANFLVADCCRQLFSGRLLPPPLWWQVVDFGGKLLPPELWWQIVAASCFWWQIVAANFQLTVAAYCYYHYHYCYYDCCYY